MPVVVELVGLPGSGKSTVFRELLRTAPDVVPKPVLRHSPFRGALAVELASATWTLVRRRALRGRTREHVVMMAYLGALPRVLETHGFAGKVVVFDQGPVYFLARPALRDARLASWRARVVESWRSHLDLVVWLDAPEDVLRSRIDERAEGHRVKGSSAEEASAFLDDARSAYEGTLEALVAGGEHPAVLCLDTSRLAVDESVARVLSAAEGLRSAAASAAPALPRPA